MTLEDYLRLKLHGELPGVKAHREFIPDVPDAEVRLRGVWEGARRSAVLVPLIAMPHAFPNVLLTVRSEFIRSHKGQISFPGGMVEDDENEVDAALREMHEETGIDIGSVQILGSLSPTYIPPSNSIVLPTVGIIQRPKEYIISLTEVREIFDVPITSFLDPESVVVKKRTLHGVEANVPMWNVHPEVPLWGATAMILNELIWIIREFVNTTE
ncbi:MAG: CoA pyrophosphatase [Ignavibacteria bacterium]|nr:CoA pyrophosphatase [Ignavibacteria bacterium]